MIGRNGTATVCHQGRRCSKGNIVICASAVERRNARTRKEGHMGLFERQMGYNSINNMQQVVSRAQGRSLARRNGDRKCSAPLADGLRHSIAEVHFPLKEKPPPLAPRVVVARPGVRRGRTGAACSGAAAAARGVRAVTRHRAGHSGAGSP